MEKVQARTGFFLPWLENIYLPTYAITFFFFFFFTPAMITYLAHGAKSADYLDRDDGASGIQTDILDTDKEAGYFAFHHRDHLGRSRSSTAELSAMQS